MERSPLTHLIEQIVQDTKDSARANKRKEEEKLKRMKDNGSHGLYVIDFIQDRWVFQPEVNTFLCVTDVDALTKRIVNRVIPEAQRMSAKGCIRIEDLLGLPTPGSIDEAQLRAKGVYLDLLNPAPNEFEFHSIYVAWPLALMGSWEGRFVIWLSLMENTCLRKRHVHTTRTIRLDETVPFRGLPLITKQ